MTAVRDGRLHPVDIGGGASAFRPEDVDALQTTTPGTGPLNGSCRRLADEGRVSFTIEQVASLVEDRMRITDELIGSGDGSTPSLLDQVANRLLGRAFGGDGSWW